MSELKKLIELEKTISELRWSNSEWTESEEEGLEALRERIKELTSSQSE